MPSERQTFRFQDMMEQEVIRINAAVSEARAVRAGGDIDAAGHQVEEAVRATMSRHLGGQYHLGQGHVVDHGWTSSSEWDCVMADAQSVPVWFTGADGTRYYRYEAVYALGSIKTKFRRGDRQIEQLVAATKQIKDELRREPTPRSFVPGLGRIRGVGVQGWPYRNPLFTFGIWAEGSDVSLDDVVRAYEGVPWRYLPNALCFMDSSVAYMVKVSKNSDGFPVAESMVAVPEFEGIDSEYECGWAMTPMGTSPGARAASNLSMLHFMLNSHLEKVVLMPSKYEILHAYLVNAGLLVWNSSASRYVMATRPDGDERPANVD